MSFSYVMNKMGEGTVGDTRAAACSPRRTRRSPAADDDGRTAALERTRETQVVGQPEIYTRSALPRAHCGGDRRRRGRRRAARRLQRRRTAERPPITPPPDDPLAGVVSVAVHPAIGIARVGNSADSFFFGPELPGSLPVAPDGFKDASGAIARQAARFRIFGYDAAGAVVREITAADAAITWTVSVANTKAAWYDFDTGDGPPGRRAGEATQRRRHRRRSRATWWSPPASRSISGPAATPVALDAGRFLDEPVPLGELLTDELGRLVFLPAEGRGYSPGQAPLTSFANNDGWSDDTCDGPVLATVTIGGRTLQAEPGWVVVAPPNYGPGAARRADHRRTTRRASAGTPSTSAELTAADVSFRDDILPILSRIVDMQWVNAGYLGSNGWGSGADYLGAATCSPGSPIRRRRAPACASRRSSSSATRTTPPSNRTPRPQMYGDGVAFPAAVAVPVADGDADPVRPARRRGPTGTFTDDRRPSHCRPTSPPSAPAEQVSPSTVPASTPASAAPTTRASRCRGRCACRRCGPARCRLRVRSTTVEHHRLGRRADTRADDGARRTAGRQRTRRPHPLAGHAVAQRRGELPLRATSRRSRPVLPTFWPARIPNHVLREVDYLVVVDTTAPMADRQAAFEPPLRLAALRRRRHPPRHARNMVDHWGELGIVTEQPGPTDGAFPAVMLVETNVGFGSEPTVDLERRRPGDRTRWCGTAGRSRRRRDRRRPGRVRRRRHPRPRRPLRAPRRRAAARHRTVRRRRGCAARTRPSRRRRLRHRHVRRRPTTSAASATAPRGAPTSCSSTDFMFNPFGSGWHLDRVAFDDRLLAAAEAAGATRAPRRRARHRGARRHRRLRSPRRPRPAPRGATDRRRPADRRPRDVRRRRR